MVLSTLFLASGQVLMKAALNKDASSVITLITQPALIGGFLLYVLAGLTITLALKHGHLSTLYPIIALGFVWVTISSILLLDEHVSKMGMAGIVCIVLGVTAIGVEHE